MSTDSIQWAWTTVSGATGYRLKTSTGGTVVDLANGSTDTWTQGGLTANTASSVDRILAYNDEGEGTPRTDASAPVYSMAVVPSALQVVSVTSVTAVLQWADGVNGGTPVYEISASTDGFVASFSTPVVFGNNLTGLTTTVFNLNPNTPYSFRMRTQNGDAMATAGFSNVISTQTNLRPRTPLVLNEIMHDNWASGTDWVEVYNNSTAAVDMTGWEVYDGDGTSWASLTLQQGNATIPVGGYAILASDAVTFLTNYGADPSSTTWTLFDTTLSLLDYAGGDTVALRDASDIIVSSVSYGIAAPWPAQVEGYSIERILSTPDSVDISTSNWALGPSSGTPGAINNAVPDTTAPGAISNLTALAGASDGVIQLSWTAPGDNEFSGTLNSSLFRIKYSTVGVISNFDSPPAGTVTLDISTSGVAALSSRSHTLTSLIPGASYWFSIETRDESNNWSIWTASVTDPAVNTLSYAVCPDSIPGVPTSVQILGRGPNFVTLSWTAPSPFPSDMAAYEIYYGTATGVYTGTSTVSGNSPISISTTATSYTVSGLIQDSTYYLALKSVDTGPNVLKSDYSAPEVSTCVTAAPPGLTSSFSGVALSTGSIQWSWSFVPNTTCYILQTAGGTDVVAINDAGTVSYIESGLSGNAPSTIARVLASNDDGRGASRTDPAAPVYTLALDPSGLSVVSVTSVSVNLSWNNGGNTNSPAYEVSMSTDNFSTSFSTPVTFASALTATYVTVSGLNPLTNYNFRVRAQNGDAIASAGFTSVVSTQTNLGNPGPIVINEIMNHNWGTGVDWVEVYNNSTSTVDMTGWQIYDGNSWRSWILQQGDANIPVGGYAIFAGGPTFLSTNNDPNSATWTVFNTTTLTLNYASPDIVALRNASSVIVSSVSFGVTSPWPVSTQGYSIERVSSSPSSRDSDATNWLLTTVSSGTPGAANSNLPDTTPPSPISNLTALAGPSDGQIQLVWTAPGDDGNNGTINNGIFEIKYTTGGIITNANYDATLNPIQISTSGVTYGSTHSRLISNLIPGSTYWFAIKTRDEVTDQWSVWNSSGDVSTVNTLASCMAPDSVPGSPQSPQASAVNRAVTVSWTAPSPYPDDVASYSIYFATYTFGTFGESAVSSKSVTAPAVTDTVSNLTNGTTYYFKVVTVDSGPNVLTSDTSTIVSAMPRIRPPSAVSATHNRTSVNLTWTASPDSGAPNFVGYNIYRSTTSGATHQLLVSTLTGTSYTDTPTFGGYSYYYVLVSSDGGLSSIETTEAAAVVQTIRPPTSVTASHVKVGTTTVVDVSWTQSADQSFCAGYNLYRSTISGSGYVLLVSSLLQGTTHQDTDNISATQDYYYVLTSSDSTGGPVSAYSNEAVAASDLSAPVITHSAINFVIYSSTPLVMSASVVDHQNTAKTIAGTVQSMTLYVRVAQSSGSYTALSFTGTGFNTSSATGTAEVPISFLQQAAAVGGFTYYISAYDGVNTGYSASAASPNTVVVDSPSSQVVGPNGGTVSSAGGFVEVVITTNALNGNVTITVTPLDTAGTLSGAGNENIPNTGGYTGRALTAGEFGPDGLRFNIPVKIKFKFLDKDGDGYPEIPPGGQAYELPNLPEYHMDRMKIYHYTAGRWVIVGGKRDGDVVWVYTPHFSTYGLFPTISATPAAPAERFVTPNADGVNDWATFGISVIRVTIFDVTGLEVWTATGDGITAIQWPGTDTKGQILESGLYLYRAEETGGAVTNGAIVIAK
ncbi:MAG TPA: fibronectin type III domain-containing protein [Elusimicrobiota bacterium]|nr:fibronectin type III domain-containing protein [Elusimicrobiota bacterium]